MSVLDVIVTAKEAQDLRCPYSGEKIVVHMLVQPGSVTFSAPDAFTLSEPVGDITELFRRASMRDGVTGIGVSDNPPKCLYTGEQMRLRTFPDGRMCYTGGFNPRAACSSLAEFLFKATMRDGVATRDNPEEFKAEHSARHRYAKKHGLTVSDDTLKVAEAVVEQTGMYTKAVRGADVPKRKAK